MLHIKALVPLFSIKSQSRNAKAVPRLQNSLAFGILCELHFESRISDKFEVNYLVLLSAYPNLQTSLWSTS